MKNIKIILLLALTVILVGGGAFYGGIKYQQSKNSFSAFSQNMRQQPAGDVSEGIVTRGAGLLAGEVLAKDEQSLTLKVSDGGSKIIFFSAGTQVSEFVQGSVSDLKVGSQITVSGEENSDGSYSAKTIQIR